MSSDNRYGDVEITDPKVMRALAHPVRLAILERLQRHGSATATQLSPHVGATPSVTSWHLRHLAGYGLVRDAEHGTDRRERRWEAVARGFRFETPADPEGRSAARVLAAEMFTRTEELPSRWLTETEPGLEPHWSGPAGVSNTRIVVTAEELTALQDAMEALVAPYVTRDEAQRPAHARGVRLLTYTLPEAPSRSGAPEADESRAAADGK